MKKSVLQRSLKPVFLRKRNWILMIILISMFKIQANGFSQDQRISLDYDQIKLGILLTEIEENTNTNFLYNVKDVDLEKEVSLHETDTSLEEILEILMKDMKLDYKIEKDQIVLFRKHKEDRPENTKGESSTSSTNLDHQQQTVTGMVLDENGMPLPGVNIVVEGTTRGTQTDFDGNYTINAEEGEVLKFSFVGFTEVSKEVGKETTIDIQMEESENALDEVVVVGYGTQSQQDNTSSISSVKPEDIKSTGTVNVAKSVQGMIPGVQISASDEPGVTPSVNIRGMGTVLGGRKPLYVVDGMFMDNIDFLNSKDIESFDVLKDASALAIYGNRGANGAIIIQTKEGRRDLSVEFSSVLGIKKPLKKLKMANANDYAEYTNISRGDNLLLEDQPYDTDWFDEVTRTGVFNEYDATVSGSSDKTDYLLSLNNYNEKAFQRGAYFNRSTLRTNNVFKISDNIKLTQNLGMAYVKSTPKSKDNFTSAFTFPSNVPVRFDDGEYGVPLVSEENGYPTEDGREKVNTSDYVDNPVSLNERDIQKREHINIVGGLKLDVDFSPFIEGLKFTSQFSGNYQNLKSYEFDNGESNIGYIAPSFENQIINTKWNSFNWITSNYFSYSTNIGDIHSIQATAGFEFSRDRGDDNWIMVRENIDPEQSYWNLSGVNYSDNITQFTSERLNAKKTSSYFGRIQYKLLDKYLFTGTLRRDGSSQFAKGNKWGTFPSFGAGWIISNENFLADNSFINTLKIRGGWGRLGNQNVPLNVQSFNSGGDYRYTFDGVTAANGATIDRSYDPSLSWEVVEEVSGGIDFELLDRKLFGSVDLYDKRTKNIILKSKPESSQGLQEEGYSHMGEVFNRGFEIALGWSDRVGEDFSYTVNLNYSFNKNELNKVSENASVIQGVGVKDTRDHVKYFGKKAEGHPLGSFYLWKTDGYDDQGEFNYVDTNNNGKTGKADDDDKQFMGSYIPKSHFGLNLNMQYKNWDFSIAGYGATGGKIFNGNRARRWGGENIERSIANNYWTPNNIRAAHPAPFASNSPIVSDYFLESGDFFRINNITLGYRLLESVDFISSLRLYLSAENPFIVKSYSGMSPEVNPEEDPYDLSGVDRNAYPDLSSFSIGIDLRF